MAGELAPVWGLLCRTWWLEGPKVDPKGLPRPPKRDPKIIENSLKLHPGPPWPSPGCQGVPPRCLQASRDAYLCVFMHVYAHIYYILCIFMHIYAYLCMFSLVLCIFMHIVVHVTHIYAYFMYIYAYSSIFMNVYVYLMHICTHLRSSCISIHIHTYLFMRRRWSAVNEKSCSRATLHRELQYLQVHSIYICQ